MERNVQRHKQKYEKLDMSWGYKADLQGGREYGSSTYLDVLGFWE